MIEADAAERSLKVPGPFPNTSGKCKLPFKLMRSRCVCNHELEVKVVLKEALLLSCLLLFKLPVS